MTTTSKIIWIETTRYSTLFRRIFEVYTEDVKIIIDEEQYRDKDIPALLTTWCTNKRIKQTQNFRLVHHGQELFSFHDHPQELMAAYSELPFVQQLRAEQIIRYEVVMAAPTSRLSTRFKTMVAKLLRRHTPK